MLSNLTFPTKNFTQAIIFRTKKVKGAFFKRKTATLYDQETNNVMLLCLNVTTVSFSLGNI